jgi:hypothetical protein
MAEAHAEKSLTFGREVYDGVTTTPHFPIEISYFGHHVIFDDIYLDDPEQFIRGLQALESSRKGEVGFDGGHRIKILFRCDSHGGVVISFRSEQQQPSFPGQCVLEGSFEVAGERVGELVHSFERLLRDGTPVSI